MAESSAAHAILEQCYMWPSRWVDAPRIFTDSMVADGFQDDTAVEKAFRKIYPGLKKYWHQYAIKDFKAYDIESIEDEFELDLHGTKIKGIIDLTLRDKTNPRRMLVLDHKFYASYFGGKPESHFTEYFDQTLQMKIYSLFKKTEYPRCMIIPGCNFIKKETLYSRKDEKLQDFLSRAQVSGKSEAIRTTYEGLDKNYIEIAKEEILDITNQIEDWYDRLCFGDYSHHYVNEMALANDSYSIAIQTGDFSRLDSQHMRRMKNAFVASKSKRTK